MHPDMVGLFQRLRDRPKGEERVFPGTWAARGSEEDLTEPLDFGLREPDIHSGTRGCQETAVACPLPCMALLRPGPASGWPPDVEGWALFLLHSHFLSLGGRVGRLWTEPASGEAQLPRKQAHSCWPPSCSFLEELLVPRPGPPWPRGPGKHPVAGQSVPAWVVHLCVQLFASESQASCTCSPSPGSKSSFLPLEP